MSTSINQFNFTTDNNNNADDEKDGGNSAAPAKRKRLTQACDACRKKKVKCSGEKPSCNNCTRLNVTCTYLPSTRKRGPRVGLVESLEKRLQQMERLLQPLKEQGLVDDSEDQSIGHSTKKPRLNPTGPNTNHDDHYSDQDYSPTSKTSTFQNSREFVTPTVKTQISSPLAQFNKPTPDGQQTEFIDPRSQQNQLKKKNSCCSMIEVMENDCNSLENSQGVKLEGENDALFFGNTSLHPGFRPNCHPNPNEESDQLSQMNPPVTNTFINFPSPIPSPLVLISNNVLPTEDIIEHLALCFFRHIDGQLSMFHEHTFMRQLRQKKISPFLVLAMCAASARYSEHPNIKRDPPYLAGEPFAEKASNFILSSFDDARLEYVQAFILLAMHSYGSAHGPRTWTYVGFATRMAHSLGLNKIDDITSNCSSDKGSEEVFIAKEVKRRTFWACFVLDRFTSCALGRPMLIQEEDCDVRFPCIESVWAMENPYNSPAIDEQLNSYYTKQDSLFILAKNGVIACFHSVVTLLGRVCKYVNRSRPTNAPPPWDPNSEFSILKNEIESWYKSILPHYSYSRERLHELMAVRSGGAFASLHLLYFTAVVLLNRSSNFVKLQKGEPMQPLQAEFLRSSTERCNNAANQVISIASDVLKVGCQYICPFTLYPIFITSTIYLNYINNEDITIANTAKENLKMNDQYLNEMAPLWAIAKKMKKMLQCMKKRKYGTSDSEALGSERKQADSEIISEGTDAGIMAYWNSANNSADVNIINNTSMNAFPDQIISSKWLYEQPFPVDSWTNFLRSPSVSPGFLRRFARNAENGENTNENGYFSQDMTLYSNNNPYTYDYSMINDNMPIGQPLSEWSNGRFMLNRRNLTDMNEIIQNSLISNQIIPSSNINVLGNNSTTSQLLNPIGSTANRLGTSNIDQTSNKEFTSSEQSTGDIQIDPILRS